MRFEDTIDIAVPADQVWALTENVEAWPTFSPTMTSIERPDSDPIAIGSRARVRQPAQRPAVWTVTRFEAGRVFAWETKVLGVLLGPVMRKSLRRENAAFKVEAERIGP